MKNFIITKLLSSKKVWIGLASIIVPFIAKAFDCDPADISRIFWSLLAILGGQAMSDFGKEAKKK